MNVKWMIGLLVTFLSFAGPLFAQVSEQNVISTSDRDIKIKVQGGPVYYSLENAEGSAITGYGFLTNLMANLNDWWAAGIGVSHAYSDLSTFQSTYTNVYVQTVWALTGSMGRYTRITAADGWRVGASEYIGRQGIRFGVTMNSYFFSTEDEITPFSGLGALLYYEIPHAYRISQSLGARYEIPSNSQNELKSLSVFWLLGYSI